MRFADITGQEDLKRHLVQSVDAGRISHAQLFTGQAGAGALALAVAYVQYLCCRHRRGGDSCGECPDCKQIAALAHPDLHLVFPVNKQGKKSGEVMRSDEFLPLFRGLFAERGGYFSAQDWYDRLDLGKTLKGMIAAREADDIIRKLSFKSFEADYKTMLIWLPEAMNEEAANKILKILEEPWEKTLFLLISEQPERLLPTIISRTQEVAVPRIAPDVLERAAQERGVTDPVKARNIARLAGGDLVELQHLVAGESDALRKENFDLFCGLMRLSYTDRPLELVTWAEEAAQLGMDEVASRAVPLDCDLSVLTDPTEAALARKLGEFGELAEGCARDRAPFRLTHYAQELAAAFHGFYTACQVLSSEGRPVDPALSQARLAACDATRRVLALTLSLIGVSAPERM